jgi:uncharacterized protein YwgA
MDAYERKGVVLDLIDRLDRGGSWCGETHIQKSVYFLQEMLGVPLDFNTIFYKHGPYSFELADELTALIANDCLLVEVRDPYGASLRPIPKAVQLYRTFGEGPCRHATDAQFVVDRLAKKTVKELERLSTALYVLNREQGDDDELAQKVNKLKPHVPIDEARHALASVRLMRAELDQERRAPQPMPTM